ncbi:acetyl-coenzyme A synthetase [bacterium BMS3Abin02]|nr:acetyl-coenzyme A synthetase [bacterium BMS3Abin02]HDL50026.1 acetoacetate--CoA ligase [Actinomycetota bacterium]
MDEVIWQPSHPEATRLHEFMQWLPGRPSSYDELWEWSITNRGDFWQALWEFADVVASVPPSRPIGHEAMPGTEWFPGARLNYAENLLRRRDGGIAIYATGEGRTLERITWAALARRVARVQAGLEALGVKPGDRVAALIPNSVFAVVGMLATAAIGAIWSSCSPDFGPLGVIDRFGQIEPKVLITADGYRYNGKTHLLADTVRAVTAQLPDLERLVIIDFVGEPWTAESVPTMTWSELESGNATEPRFAQLPFDHPLLIMYSSGTTGPPKSIVHGAGGTLLKHLSEHQLHSDVRKDDVVFWFSTCGWMMWNWLVTALASQASIVVYDGSPAHPDLEVLWKLAAEIRITHFGTSPKFLSANANAGVVPAQVADLSAVRWLGSTGMPLNPDQFDWVYANVKDDVQLASISGGTDIIGCFALGVPILPVRRGQLQARALGMAVESWDEEGKPHIGRKGELVCTRPFPSMPVSFWKDPDGKRYRSAYFEKYPGVWTHGDFIEIRPQGGVIIYGRSDTTLNPSGVRIGTAEIYRAVEPMPEIDDSIVVGHQTSDNVEVVLCVKLADGVTLDDVLERAIRDRIRSETSPRHVPRYIFAVDAIPYTISGKKVEKAVRSALARQPVTNKDALVNPESLEQYEHLL